MSNVWITDKDFSCSLAATSNITLSGLYTLDGVAITAGMTVLAAGQTDSTASGPYIAKLGVWDRVVSLATGQQFYIALGSTNGTKIFELQTPIPFTVGVTSLSFVTPIVSGTPPIGTAGGDLSGTYPNPLVLGFNGKPLTASAPASGSQIVFDGTTWQYQMGVSGPPSGPAGGDLAGSYPNPTVATGLSATKIADGSVSNAEFQYLDGVTSGIQSQIDGKLSSSSTKLPPTPTGAGKLIYDNGTAYVENTAGTTDQVLVGGSTPSFSSVPAAALTSVPSSALTGTIGIANIPTGTSSSTVTIGNDSRLPPTPTTAGKIPYDTGSAYAETSAGTTNQVLLGGTTPSFDNVPSAALTSIPAGNLTGTVPIGTIPTGTSSSTVTIGNDTRLPPTPTAGGKILYDSAGTSYAESAAGTSGQILISGGTGSPTWTSTPSVTTLTAATSVTTPLLTSASGTTQINATTGNGIALTINNAGLFSVTASGANSQGPLAMSSNKITGLVTGTASGDALCYPWITSVNGEATLGSTYTISTNNGAYEDTGLSVTLPSSGTFLVWYQARSNINATTTAGAYILTEMYNSTDATDVSNTEQIGAYGSTVGASYYQTSFVQKIITVGGSKVIKLYAKVVAPSTTSIRTINSDANGRSRMGYMQIA